jgi:hypothetical protein
MTTQTNPNITAAIDARGKDSCIPDRPDAVDATISSGGTYLCDITLCPDGDGDLDVWGDTPDSWCSDFSAVQHEAHRTATDIDIMIRAIVDAVRDELDEEGWSSGDQVEGGDTAEDYDRGEVTAVDGDQITVAWGSGVVTTQAAGLLRAQGTDCHESDEED